MGKISPKNGLFLRLSEDPSDRSRRVFEIRRELGYPDSITARCIKVFACDRNWADKQIDTVIRDLTWSYKK